MFIDCVLNARHFDQCQEPDQLSGSDDRRAMDLLRRFKDVNTSLVMKNRRLVTELTDLNMLIVRLRMKNRLITGQLDEYRSLGPEISQEVDRLMNLADKRLENDREMAVLDVDDDSSISNNTIEEVDNYVDAVEEEEDDDDDLRAEFDRRLQLEMKMKDENDDNCGSEKQSDENSLSLFAVFKKFIQTTDNNASSVNCCSSPPPKLIRMDQVETVVDRRRAVVGGRKPPKPELMLSPKKKTTSESRQKSSKDQPKKKAVAKESCGIGGCKFKCRREEAKKLSTHRQYHHKDRLTSKKVIGYRSGAPVYGCDLTGCQFQSRFSSHVNRHKLTRHSSQLKGNNNSPSTVVGVKDRVWFPCPFGCGYQTLNRGHLNTHKRNFHR